MPPDTEATSRIPSPIVDLLNAHLADQDLPVHVTSIAFPEADQFLVHGTVKKFLATLRVEVRATLTFEHGELVVSDIEVSRQGSSPGKVERKILDWITEKLLRGQGERLRKHRVRLRC